MRDWVFRTERARGHSGPWHVRRADLPGQANSTLCGEYLPNQSDCDITFEDDLCSDGIEGVLCERCQVVGERRERKRKLDAVTEEEIRYGAQALRELGVTNELSNEQTAYVAREVLAAAQP